MSTYIQNQPVFFGDPTECTSDELQFKQLVDNTDSTQFQFEIEPCATSVQLMPDPQFSDPENYVLPDNWSIVDGVLCLSGLTVEGSTVTTGTSGTTILSVFTLGGYYQVNVTVDSISLGGEIEIWIGADVIGTINSPGSYTFYGFATNQFAIYGYPLAIVSTVEGTNVCISEITSYEILTNFMFPIYELDGTQAALITYEDDPDYFSFVDNTLTVTINWAELELSNNCYYICLLDPCTNTNGQNYPAVIENCEFTGSATGWTLSGDATYTANTITSTAGAFGIVEQANVFDSYSVNYFVEVVITAITGTVEVYFGTNLAQTISSTGTHLVSGVTIGNFTLKIQSLIGSSMTLTSACPKRVESHTCNMQSNNFKVADFSSDCTILINACNNENGLGFNFSNSGFTPRIRLEAKLKQAKYTQERSIQEDSLGKKGVNYFSGRKSKNLAIDLQPEYVHDFLRLLGGFDNVYLDGDLYFVDDDEYSVDYGDQDNIGKVNILVSPRTQNVKNINCSSSENVCNLGENILLQADDLTQNILLTTGETISING